MNESDCFFDLCGCPMWTLNCILYEIIWKRCRFRTNINEPFSCRRIFGEFQCVLLSHVHVQVLQIQLINLYIPSIDFSVEIEEGIHQNFDEYLHWWICYEFIIILHDLIFTSVCQFLFWLRSFIYSLSAVHYLLFEFDALYIYVFSE